MREYPIPISDIAKEMRSLNPNTFLPVGGIWGGALRAGQTVVAADGKRFIWSADNVSVTYSVGNKFFRQGSTGFIGDLRTAPGAIAGRNSSHMVTIAKLEMKFLMGFAAGASTVGFAAVVGTEIGGFALENRSNFDMWYRLLKGFLKARDAIKLKCPQLYDKVFNAILSKVWRDWKANLTGAVTDEIVAFAVGVIAGSATKKLADGTFSLLKVALVLLEQVAVRFLLNVSPGALANTARDYHAFAETLVANLQATGVVLSEADKRAIFDEIMKHPKEVKQALEAMRTVVDGRP